MSKARVLLSLPPITAALLFAVGCDSELPDQQFQPPSIEEYWIMDEGTAWLYQPERAINSFFRLQVAGDAEVAGADAVAFDWYRGSESQVWPNDGADAPTVPVFQRMYFSVGTLDTVLYHGRDDQGSGEAWDGAAELDPPAVWAAGDIRFGETTDSETGGVTWSSTYVDETVIDTFFQGDLPAIRLDITESGSSAGEAGRWWLSARRGIVALEVAALTDGDDTPVRLLLDASTLP